MAAILHLRPAWSVHPIVVISILGIRRSSAGVHAVNIASMVRAVCALASADRSVTASIKSPGRFGLIELAGIDKLDRCIGRGGELLLQQTDRPLTVESASFEEGGTAACFVSSSRWSASDAVWLASRGYPVRHAAHGTARRSRVYDHRTIVPHREYAGAPSRIACLLQRLRSQLHPPDCRASSSRAGPAPITARPFVAYRTDGPGTYL